MQYLEMITASKTWECPKTGVYKITCVGGGASGGYTASATEIYAPVSGGITSFGDLVTAAGGGYDEGCLNMGSNIDVDYGGMGGYTPYSFGGTGALYNTLGSTGNGGLTGFPGTGYGASGSGYLFSINEVKMPLPSPTEMIQGIFTLVAGDSYEVTIGEGGDILTPAADLTLTDTAGAAVTSSYASNIAKYCTNGRSGVCVVQYLGQDY
ncbi:MAG: hypothetical protein LUI05_03045 [Oscillospiraceae bacterium]|nr:hypothetical protein [Oscillospiraceae bacterium]